jgi:hypothetical protein
MDSRLIIPYYRVCICGVLRITFIWLLYTTTYDLTWKSLPLWIFTAIEPNIAIICASAPALKSYFNRYIPSSFPNESSAPWSNTTIGGGKGFTGDYSQSERHTGKRNTEVKWTSFGRSKAETYKSETEITSSFSRDMSPDRINGRGSTTDELDNADLENIVVRTEIKTSITPPGRIKTSILA